MKNVFGIAMITLFSVSVQVNALVYDIYNKSNKTFEVTLIPNSKNKPFGTFIVGPNATLKNVFYNTSYGSAGAGAGNTVTSWGVKQIKVVDKSTGGQTFITDVSKKKQDDDLKINLFYNETQAQADLAKQPVGIWVQYSTKK